MLDGFPSGRTGSICSADMCGDEVAGVVVCRCRLAASALLHAQCVAGLVGILFVACVAIQIQFRFNPDSDPRYPDISGYPPKNESTPFFSASPFCLSFLVVGTLIIRPV